MAVKTRSVSAEALPKTNGAKKILQDRPTFKRDEEKLPALFPLLPHYVVTYRKRVVLGKYLLVLTQFFGSTPAPLIAAARASLSA